MTNAAVVRHTCLTCGKEFTAFRRDARFCSKQCMSYQGPPCEDCGKPLAGMTDARREGMPLHLKCRKLRRARQDTCFICGDMMAQSVESAEPGKRAHAKCWKDVGIPRVCNLPGCGIEFTAHAPVQVHCSAAHAQTDGTFARGPVCTYCGGRMRASLKLSKSSPVHIGCKRLMWVDGACYVCGKPMVTNDRKKCRVCTARGRMCSKEGCNKPLKALGLCQYHYTFEHYPPSDWIRFSITEKMRCEVIARDKGICQICKLPVDFTARSRTYWSRSMDHIVPVSLQLFADNSLKNLRLAHCGCNSTRQNHMEDEKVAEKAQKLWAKR